MTIFTSTKTLRTVKSRMGEHNVDFSEFPVLSWTDEEGTPNWHFCTISSLKYRSLRKVNAYVKVSQSRCIVDIYNDYGGHSISLPMEGDELEAFIKKMDAMRIPVIKN